MGEIIGKVLAILGAIAAFILITAAIVYPSMESKGTTVTTELQDNAVISNVGGK